MNKGRQRLKLSGLFSIVDGFGPLRTHAKFKRLRRERRVVIIFFYRGSQ